MSIIYLLGLKNTEFSESSRPEHFSRRKIDNDIYAVQIWDSLDLITQFKQSMPNSENFSINQCEKEYFTAVMKKKDLRLKVELNAEPLKRK